MSSGGLLRLCSDIVAEATRSSKTCGADRDRTDDLRLAKPALSQLSYSPVGAVGAARYVGQGRVELPTSRLSGVRSNHLSYWPQEALPAMCWLALFRGLRDPMGPRSLETEPYAR